jgi:DNA repair and recombination protein RAD54 and RAD54-like protein
MPPLSAPGPLAHRPRNTYENSPLVSSTLAKPFTPPLAKRASVLPARKKRKTTSYAEDSADSADTATDSIDSSYTASDNRVVLGGLDINALKARRRESGEVFRKEFIVPVKENGAIERRVGNAPSLGMLRPANFVARPLHDPAGEFAIVLYDPTIDDEPTPKILDGMHMLGIFVNGSD